MGRPALWVTLTCPTCGRDFQTKPCKMRMGQRYCSRSCAQVIPRPWNIGNQYACRGDRGTRAAYMYRARQLTKHVEQCERCDRPAELTHHKDENWRNNTLTNLERLCRPCHVAHHRKELEMGRLAYYTAKKRTKVA